MLMISRKAAKTQRIYAHDISQSAKDAKKIFPLFLIKTQSPKLSPQCPADSQDRKNNFKLFFKNGNEMGTSIHIGENKDLWKIWIFLIRSVRTHLQLLQ